MPSVEKIKQCWLLVALVLITSCAGKESLSSKKLVAEPAYELSAIRFKEVDMEKLNLEVDLKVTNPNYLNIEFSQLNYQLTIDGKPVLSDTLSKPILVKARSESIVTIPLSVSMDKLVNGPIKLMMNRHIYYHLETSLSSSTPILEKTDFKIVKTDELRF